MQIPSRKKTFFFDGVGKSRPLGRSENNLAQMLGRNARENRKPESRPRAATSDRAVPETARTDLIAGKCGRDPTTPGHTDAFQGSRITHSEARSRRCEAIAKETAAKGAEQWFYYEVDAFTSSRISGAACGARLRASAARCCGPHGSKNPTTATTKSSARAGCGEGRACRHEPAPGARQILHFVQNDKKTRSDTRQQNCKHPTVIPRRDNKRPPPTRKRPRKTKAAGKSKQKTTTNRKRAKTIKKNRKTTDKAPPERPPNPKRARQKKRAAEWRLSEKRSRKAYKGF